MQRCIAWRGFFTFRSMAIEKMTPKQCWEALESPDIQANSRELAAALDRISRKRLVISAGSPDQKGLEKLLRSVKNASATMQCRDLSAVFAAAARLGCNDREFWNAVALRGTKIAATMEPSSISRLLGAAVRSGFVDHKLVKKLIEAAASKSGEFPPNTIGPMFATLSTLEMYSKPLFKSLCEIGCQHPDEFDARAIAWTLSALAKFGVNNTKFVELLCHEALSRMEEFDSKLIGVTLNALAKLERNDEVLIARFCERLQQSGDISPHNLSNVLNALAKFKAVEAGRPAVAALCARVLAHVDSFNHQDISITLNALSRMQMHDGELVSALCTQAMSVPNFTSRDLTNMFTALAALHIQNPDLVRRLCEVCHTIAGQFNPQEISNTLSAFTLLQVRDQELVLQLCASARSQLKQFNEQNIGSMLRSLGRLGVRDADTITGLCLEATEKLSTFRTQDIVNALQGLASLRVSDHDLVGRLCDMSSERVESFTPAEIAHVFDALTELDFRHPLISRLCSFAFSKAPQFQAHHLVSIVAALGQLQVYEAPLVTRVCLESMLRAEEFSATNMSDLLFALTYLNVYDEALVQRAMCVPVPIYHPSGLSKALYSLAIFNVQDKGYVLELCAQVPSRAAEFSDVEAVRTLFALCCLECFDQPALAALKDRLRSLKSASLLRKAEDQLLQSRLRLSLQGISDICTPNFKRTLTARPAKPSRLHEQLASALQSLSLPHQRGHDLGGLWLDLALVDRKVAIEADEPEHSFRHSQRLRGDVRFRRRLAELLGWQVKTFSAADWKGAEAADLELALRALLA